MAQYWRDVTNQLITKIKSIATDEEKLYLRGEDESFFSSLDMGIEEIFKWEPIEPQESLSFHYPSLILNGISFRIVDGKVFRLSLLATKTTRRNVEQILLVLKDSYYVSSRMRINIVDHLELVTQSLPKHYEIEVPIF